MKKEEKENQKIIDEYDYLSNAASSHDCTGLIPPSLSLPKRSSHTRNCITSFPLTPEPLLSNRRRTPRLPNPTNTIGNLCIY